MAPTLSLLFLTISSLLSSAYCAPAPPRYPDSSSRHTRQVSVQRLQTNQPTLSLPSNSNVTLQYVALGVGVQNYSCETGAPESIGAIATLFDITDYLQQKGRSRVGKHYLQAYERQTCQASQNLDDNTCETSINYLDFSVLGHHFFTPVGDAAAPIFEIYDDQRLLSAQKVGVVPAPARAYDGEEGFGAIDWLFLPSDGSQRTVGLSEVYRIHTAGGSPDPEGCAAVPAETVLSYKYVAQYWFYS
ncbi:hypothetical protein LTR37_007805 [Vermiconidia calcicola]|uniref:Uncharacterized protein n=1 Tax=Vermiconidia calcicola TaxID=1690605 RepID=A0ACC3NCL9_9PEZI|nr:hypothetical protein LTR37_007805 [Vermiconidia calcicola]